MERSGARWPVLDWPVLDWPTLDWPALDWRAAGWLAGESPDPSSRALARPIRKQIGRAPCRGRGEISGVAVSLKKKKQKRMRLDGYGKHPTRHGGPRMHWDAMP